MSRRAVSTAVLAVLVVLAASPLVAQEAPVTGSDSAALGPQRPDSTPGCLVGAVVDLDGHSLGGVEVTLLPAALRQTTFDSGRFTFRAVPPGWYVALLRRIGSRRVTFDVEVRPGAETRVRYACRGSAGCSTPWW